MRACGQKVEIRQQCRIMTRQCMSRGSSLRSLDFRFSSKQAKFCILDVRSSTPSPPPQRLRIVPHRSASLVPCQHLKKTLSTSTLGSVRPRQVQLSFAPRPKSTILADCCYGTQHACMGAACSYAHHIQQRSSTCPAPGRSRASLARLCACQLGHRTAV